MLSERDLVGAVADGGERISTMKVEALMTRDPITCDMDDSPFEVLHTMNRKGFRHMPVLKNGKLKGPAKWIKLHRDLLGNYDFQQLPERDRYCVVGFYLLAAESHNKIPEDIPWIKRKLAIKRHPPIDALVASGFLERT